MDQRLSSALYDACHARPAASTLVSTLCRALEWSGDGRLWFALWAVLAGRAVLPGWVVWTSEADVRETSRLLLELLLADLALVGALKWAVKRRRPSYGRAPTAYVVEVDRYSFPSGHASRAMAIGVGMYGGRSGAVAWAVAWALLVGVSRVAYGRPWPGDVAGGWAVGLAVALAVRAFSDSRR